MSIYRFWKKVTAGVLFASLLIIIFTVNSNISIGRSVQMRVGVNETRTLNQVDSKQSTVRVNTPTKPSKYILDTDGCKIPRTPIMPEYFKSRWHVQKIPNCDYETVLSELDDSSQMLHLTVDNSDVNASSCCIHEIGRVAKKDSEFILSKCELFAEEFVDVSQREMLVTKCGKNLNFEANIPIKPNVQTKINYWKHRSKTEQPLNVLFLGIDSVSRSHAHRSLPISIGFMKKMGFVDFPGYHSIAGSTLSNFMGFLMGLTRRNVRKECAPDWTSPFDSCPFIWKEFSLRNYVTMYVEDGSQTFNWGGQAGFYDKPTDYYIHALFTAMNDLRLKYSGIQNTSRDIDTFVPCASYETVPKFMLRYTKRFLQKFHRTPFFTFTWFGNPFHDYLYSLANFDKDLFKFLEDIRPDLMENTVIILVSDHGDRTSFFQTNTMDAFIERGLPPLFIRFPEKLKKLHPELDLDDTLSHNVNSLISPFDLHHTLLHILALNDAEQNTSKSPEFNFKPIISDRRSLLVPIDSTRNCEQINIETGNCVCNTATEVEPIKNPFYLTKIITFLGKRLNHIVKSSKYKKVCAKWVTHGNLILSTQIIQKTNHSTDALIQFSADPGSAHFEAKIRIGHEKSKYDGCQLIGDFSRINRYGNQSSCVQFKTDYDKKMKEFCMCKSMVIDKRM